MLVDRTSAKHRVRAHSTQHGMLGSNSLFRFPDTKFLAFDAFRCIPEITGSATYVRAAQALSSLPPLTTPTRAWKCDLRRRLAVGGSPLS